MDRAGIAVEVIPSDFDERSINIIDPIKLVKALALAKAETVVKVWNETKAETQGSALIIGADTMVLFEGKLIGKAKNKEDAARIIGMFAGHTHELLTGVAVINSATLEQKVFADSSKVHFQPLSTEEITTYLNVTDEFRGRAGAYSLQERASLFIDRIEGSPTNVLGLPMAKLRTVLKEFGANLLVF